MTELLTTTAISDAQIYITFLICMNRVGVSLDACNWVASGLDQGCDLLDL